MQQRTPYAALAVVGIVAATLAVPAPATADGAPMPVRPQAVTIAAGEAHTVVMGADGRVYGTGNNEYEQVTRSQPTLTNLEPMAGLPSRVRATAVSAGWGHSVVLGSDGVAYATGLNYDHQLTGTDPRSVLTAMTGLPAGVRATRISAGGFSTLVIGSDGRPYGVGGGGDGEITGTKEHVKTLTPMTGLPAGVRATSVVGGFSAPVSIVIGSDGVAYGTGQNDEGQLTGHAPRSTLTPMIGLPEGVRAVAAAIGYAHCLVLGSDGTVYGTGSDARGQLGGTGSREILAPVTGLPEGVRATAVAAGFRRSLVLGSDGRAYATGENTRGELTGADNLGALTPMTGLPAGASASEIATGGDNSLVRTTDGLVYGAGANDQGQLTGPDTADVRALTVLTRQHIKAVTPPAILGRALVGRMLRLDVGTYSPTPAGYSYAWYRDGIPIPHATGTTHTLTTADWKHRITARVVAVNPHATLAAVYTPATAHVRFRLVPTGWPRIRGTLRAGHVLKPALISWGVRSDQVRTHYQWYRGHKKIKHATKARYRVTRKDRGKKLRVRVTATAPYAYPGSRTSAAVRIRRH